MHPRPSCRMPPSPNTPRSHFAIFFFFGICLSISHFHSHQVTHIFYLSAPHTQFPIHVTPLTHKLSHTLSHTLPTPPTCPSPHHKTAAEKGPEAVGTILQKAHRGKPRIDHENEKKSIFQFLALARSLRWASRYFRASMAVARREEIVWLTASKNPGLT